jgi:uncharacterized membrane protein
MSSPGENLEKTGNRKFSAVLSLAVGGLFALYPLLMYVGQRRLGVRWIAFVLIAICAIRLVALRFGRGARTSSAFGWRELLLFCGGAIALALVSVWRDSPDALLYYPVFMNAAMLLLFGSSLVFPPTIVERIARIRHPGLPVEAVPYLRRVTIAWCIFFVGNGAVALYTVLRTSFETWALYNGLVAYVLIGAMFAGEFLTRMRVMTVMRR